MLADSNDEFDGGLFVAPEAGFALTLPRGFSRPKLTSEESDVNAHGGLYTAVSQGDVCSIGLMPLPRPLTSASERRKFFEESMAGMVRGMSKGRKAELTSQKEVTFAGTSGLSGRVTITIGERTMLGRIDVCAINGKLYGLLYLKTDGKTIEGEDVRSVYASFTVTKIDPNARASSATGEKTFAPREGNFSVSFPPGSTTPKMVNSEIPGGITVHKYVAYTASNAYILSHVAVSMASLTADEHKRTLAMIRDSELENLNAQPGIRVALKREYDTTLGGLPHHVAILRGEGNGKGLLYRLDIVITKEEVYELMASARGKGGKMSEEFDRFFSSFTITTPPTKQ